MISYEVNLAHADRISDTLGLFLTKKAAMDAIAHFKKTLNDTLVHVELIVDDGGYIKTTYWDRNEVTEGWKQVEM